MNTTITSSLYRSGVGIVLLNKENKVFIGRRIKFYGKSGFQMPQGGIEGSETPEEAAIRELKEETSIQSVEIIAQTKDWLYYDLPKSVLNKLWNGKYKGQKQKWFLFRFVGDESEINVHVKNQEFDKWSWIEPEKLPSIIVRFKKKMYSSILKEFSPIIEGIKVQ